jgi:hypothetical protein
MVLDTVGVISPLTRARSTSRFPPSGPKHLLTTPFMMFSVTYTSCQGPKLDA